MVSMSKIRGRGLEFQIMCEEETLKRLLATGRDKEYKLLKPIVVAHKKELKRRSSLVLQQNPAIVEEKPDKPIETEDVTDILLNKDEMLQKIIALQEAGHTSTRAIAKVLNVSHMTIARKLKGQASLL